MRGNVIAEYVIEHAKECEIPITNLKLQKTLYYLQGYSYRQLRRAAIDDDFFNWQYGPVIPSVYFEYSHNGSDPLMRRSWIPLPTLDPEQRRVFNRVIKECLHRNTSELVEMSHHERPWKNTKLRDRIPQASIQDYFERNNPLELVF